MSTLGCQTVCMTVQLITIEEIMLLHGRINQLLLSIQNLNLVGRFIVRKQTQTNSKTYKLTRIISNLKVAYQFKFGCSLV
jgi:hypothetical protein